MEIWNRLREAREQRGLTLSDISHATKIPTRMLEAIERNDIARLPHSFFTRAYLRAYAAEVGVDPAEVLGPYLTPFQSEPAEPLDHDDLDTPDIEEERRASHGWLVVVLGIAAAYGIYGVSPRSTADALTTVAPLDVATPTSESHSAPVPVSDVAPMRDVMQLQIQSGGACMVSATADGEPVISRLVQAGENATIEGRGEIVLHVADAGGCVYSVSSTSGRRLHRSGETVIRLTEESGGSLLASAARRGAGATRPAQMLPVSTLEVAGTTGVLQKAPEVAGMPIDASIISLLPTAPVPAAPVVSDALSISSEDATSVGKQ